MTRSIGSIRPWVALHPDLEDEELAKGQEVVLNESFNVVLARGPEHDVLPRRQ